MYLLSGALRPPLLLLRWPGFSWGLVSGCGPLAASGVLQSSAVLHISISCVEL